MSRKTCLITGSTSGIGKETAKKLAGKKYKIIVHGRNKEKGKKVLEEIEKGTGNRCLNLELADFSSFEEVRNLADKVEKDYKSLDILINNAGIWLSERKLTKNGVEMTFAVNHLSHFLLTNLLIGKMVKSPSARIINVSSEVHQNASIEFDGLTGERGPSGYEAYKQSKLANVLFTFELADRLDEENITANCLHPGTVRSNFGRKHRLLKYIWKWFPLFKSPEKGAETPVYLATSEEVENTTGKYFVDMEEEEPSPKANDRQLRQKLWDTSKELVGLEKSRI